ncbi:MAG: acylphosphatase family protein [Pseudonocardiales bacterium]|nr:acylphosphatase family protein [Pseudonocardiales bacterium]
MSEVRLAVSVEGNVQGVGFRYRTSEVARALGLRGAATNRPDGRVAIVVEGPLAACEELLSFLRGPRAPGSVATVTPSWGEATEATEATHEPAGFRIG